MARPISSWISHVEAFVDSSRSPKDQATSISAIATLLKKDLLTFEALVREMEMYLTTSDHVIRSRGILLLAEIMTHLLEKPFDSPSISSLAGFFTAKLEDWHALHGVLIGCLALLRRTKKFGMVESNDARALFESFLRNVDAQSLAVLDRKLCFEVLQCLLNNYPEIAAVLGEDLVYGICAAIDEEKDPRCLMLTFHLVESLARLFPDPSGPVGSSSSDIFDILSRYFPIYFTHPKSDSLGINRDDISTALLHAFSSAPYFEPYAIPLLLEKLSSSLPLAKLDSLIYLHSCICCYGADRMARHARAIWANLKVLILNLSQRPSLLTSETDGDVQSETNQIAKEALNCFQAAVLYLNSGEDSFLRLIIEDEDIKMMFESVLSERDYKRDNVEIQNKLSVLGSILYTTSKVSIHCCTKVYRKFFPSLMVVLGVSPKDSSCSFTDDYMTIAHGLNFGALVLCIELLSSCRELLLVSKESSIDALSEQNGFFYMLRSYSRPLCYTFCSVLQTAQSSMARNDKSKPEYVLYAVKGLQLLATFPRSCTPISESTYEDILVTLMSVISVKSQDIFLWNLSLDTLVQIGSFIENVHDSDMGISYKKLVVEPVISLLQLDDSIMPIALKLDAISKIGCTGLYLPMVIKALEEFIFSNLESCIKGNLESAEILSPILECYSNQVLPRCCTSVGCGDVAVQFAVRVWNQMGNMPATDDCIMDRVLLKKVMMTMKLVVASCTENNQSLILQKVNTILVSMNIFGAWDTSTFPLSKLEESCVPNLDGLSCRDEWVVSLLASVVIALHPETPLVNVNMLVNLFTSFLLKGFIPAAQALASMINKWPANIEGLEVKAAYTLDQVIELILERTFPDAESGRHISNCNFKDESFHEDFVFGLAWVGKGLLMRGHGKVKEITMLLLKFLVLNKNVEITSSEQGESGSIAVLDKSTLLSISAADAFKVIMSDSEDCLNKKFHATVKPLYKQRFFSSVLPILLSAIKQSDSSAKKNIVHRAFGNIICTTPLAAVVTEAKKIIPSLLDALAMLSSDIHNKDMIYSLLLILSGILMDDDGKEVVLENISTVISHLVRLVSYPHMMLVRETAIQCLVAISGFPHARIYPLRPQVLQAVSTALDDRKRAVRQEAVRCRQAWASIASRSLQF